MAHPPNIVLVLFDQLRFDVVAGARCATPNLDRLRRHATWFEEHHTTTGLCSPARGSLMTGLFPHTHGVLNNVHGRAAIAENLPDDHATFGELLTEAGYRTGYVGKWHLGRGRSASHRGWTDVRFPAGDDDPALAAGLRDHLDSMVYTRPHHDGGQHFALYLRDPVPPSLVPAYTAFEEGLGLLSAMAAGRTPFCLVVATPEPHHPTILTEEYLARYDPASMEPWPNHDDPFTGKPRSGLENRRHYGVADFTWADWAPVVARYLATVTMLDDLLGRLLDELERLDRDGDTVVVVTTDHGDLLGSHGCFNKGPIMAREVYRVPFCIRLPTTVPAAPGAVDALTSHVDLVPTLAELAGVALPPRSWPGRSLVPWLVGDDPPGWRRTLLCEFHGDEFGLYSQRMVRSGDHVFVYNPNDVDELYDLSVDPHELHNLAADPTVAELRRGLERALLEAMLASGDPLAEFAGVALG